MEADRPGLMPSYDAWIFRRLLAGMSLNGELGRVSAHFSGIAADLNSTSSEARHHTWKGFLLGRPDAEIIAGILAETDPTAEAPPVSNRRSYATLSDIARVVSGQPWTWRNWIAAAVLNACAAEPGVGKTRLAADLARRLYHKLPWPDGQENEWPAGTRTLWVQGDRNFPEMLQVARDFGVPEDAWALGTTPDDPTGGLDMDDPDTLAALEDHIRASDAALVVIDTVGMVTSRNLCRTDEARDFFAPLIEVAQRTGVAILGLTHLSANKEALGRRIVEKARVVIKMTQPDPEGQENRRRLWVDKSAVVKPPALGITMADVGNDYDHDPPKEPEPTPRKTGPASRKLEECKTWLIAQLSAGPARVSQVRSEAEKAGHSTGTLYNAVEALKVEEKEIEGKKLWRMTGSP